MTDRDRITRLLEHLPDYFALGQPGQSGTGSDSNVGRFRLAEHPSVKELFRCLLILRANQPHTYHDLKAFYMAETRIARVKKRSHVPANTRFVYESSSRCYCYRERILSRLVDSKRVSQGVDWIVENFEGEPCLPKELLVA